jgi:hypothetical protein
MYVPLAEAPDAPIVACALFKEPPPGAQARDGRSSPKE